MGINLEEIKIPRIVIVFGHVLFICSIYSFLSVILTMLVMTISSTNLGFKNFFPNLKLVDAIFLTFLTTPFVESFNLIISIIGLYYWRQHILKLKSWIIGLIATNIVAILGIFIFPPLFWIR